VPGGAAVRRRILLGRGDNLVRFAHEVVTGPISAVYSWIC
jgi:hypothetical protein